MAFNSINPPDIPPYQLQQLVPLVFESSQSGSDVGLKRSPTTSSATPPEITCAQALGAEIYVGCSDGTLLRYALQGSASELPASYSVLSRQTLPTNKAINQIALLPSISRALILSDHQIHFYAIPSLDPVPGQIMRPIRGVLSFAVDEQHMRLAPPALTEQRPPEPVEFCVIKRSVIGMYSLRDRLSLQREIPNAQGVRYARRTGRFLCAADAETYIMIDLIAASAFALLPITQVHEGGSASIGPIAAVVSDEEFLLVSSMGQSAMGVFVTGNGDPVRGTIEWVSYPVSVCIDYPYVITLLPNQTVEIHNLDTQALVQVISSYSPSPPTSPSVFSSDLRWLVSCPAGYQVPLSHRTDKLTPVAVRLIDESNNAEAVPNLPPPKSSLKPSGRLGPFPKSNALLLSNNSIQSLLPSTLISQAESLLESHRVEDAVDLVDQNQRRQLATSILDSDLAEEIRYVYQRIGFQCLSETLFEDAGRHLLEGETDPRLLVRFFPDLRGKLLDATSHIDVFAGVANHLPREKSIEEIVVANIVRNYSPHIKPDTYTAPPTAELRRVLCVAARDMLAAYLRKLRTRRLVGRGGFNSHGKAVDTVVDTVLVKIFAESEKTAELYTIVDEPNDIVISEVEDCLEKNGQYNALCKLYTKCGDEEKLLMSLSKIADGLWTDEDIKDPLSRIIEILNKTANRTLLHRWALWLIKKEADVGLKLIISRDAKRASKADELELLTKIQDASEVAGLKYLEFLVLDKRSQDRSLHNKLASLYVKQLIHCLSDERTSKLWRAKASSYASSPNDTPFLSYFTSTTPESESRNTRLKMALFLQGSDLYDIQPVIQCLQEHKKILSLEVAILLGKLGSHEEAISTLVHELHDSTTAEAYCTLGGDVIPTKIAWAAGERCGLQRWAALVAGIAPAIGPSSSNISSASVRSRVTDEATKAHLLKVLLRVYMSGGESTASRSSRLLNSQALNFDVVDVIHLFPQEWPLDSVSSFLSRSFRRTLHTQHEGQIIKAISSGQNLEVVEDTWLVLREQGAVIEEAATDEEDGRSDGGNEKELDEKIGLHEIHSEPNSVAEIRLEERKASDLSGSESYTQSVDVG